MPLTVLSQKLSEGKITGQAEEIFDRRAQRAMKFTQKTRDATELWKAEVLARFKEPRCWVCAHAVNEVHRDFFWFVNEQYYEIGMIDKMRLAYGFCPAHTRHFLHTGARSVAVTVFSYLTWYVLTRLNAARDLLGRGDSKQDRRQLCVQAAAVLRPPGTCPMCESVWKSEQTNLHVLIDTLGLGEIRDAYHRSPGLCLPHLRQAGQRAEWDTLAFLSGDLQRRLQAKLFPDASANSLLEQTAGLDRERSLRHHRGSNHLEPGRNVKETSLEMYIELGNPSYSWSPTFEQMVTALAEPGCPVCRACERGLHEYLAWLAEEMETQASRSNTWELSWRVCPSHLWELDMGGHERAAIVIAEHMVEDWLLKLDRLNRGLSTRPSARWLARLGNGFRVWRGRYDPDASDPEARRRSRWSKMKTVLEPPQEKLDSMRAIAFRGEACQACIHLETIAMRRLELILRVLEDPAGRKAYHAGWGLCLRHCVQAAGLAEVPSALSELLSAQIARLRFWSGSCKNLREKITGQSVTKQKARKTRSGAGKPISSAGFDELHRAHREGRRTPLA